MNEHELRLLVANRAPLEVIVTRTDGGFSVTVNGAHLRSVRQAIRPFAKLDTVCKLLSDAGVSAFMVRPAE